MLDAIRSFFGDSMEPESPEEEVGGSHRRRR